MRYVNPQLRPGMTALAAALALSSTPLFAQDATTADTSAPTVVVPPPAPSPAAAATSSSALNIPQITVNMDDAPKTATETISPVAKRTTVSAGPVQHAEASPKSAPKVSAPAPAALPATSPQPVVEPAVPLSPSETTMVPPPPAVVPPTPVAKSNVTNTAPNDVLPIAGGILGALALVGGGFAAVSRKRRREDVDADKVVMKEPRPLTVPFDEPVTTRPFVAAPEMRATNATLPSGFDISRYGPHVQAAYGGPTPDNPSLSLRKRLKRARFYDQRERMASSASIQPTVSHEHRQAPATRPERTTEYVTSRGIGGGNIGFRPAFQN